MDEELSGFRERVADLVKAAAAQGADVHVSTDAQISIQGTQFTIGRGFLEASNDEEVNCIPLQRITSVRIVKRGFVKP